MSDDVQENLPPARLMEAWRRFDEVNARDPTSESDGTNAWPRELFYAHRLTDWVLKLNPNASEALRLAARCQHLGRWEIPRATYPMNRAGYLRWRSDLRKLHAQRSAAILRDLAYPEEVISRVRDLNLKKNLQDPEMQVLEDSLCLMFLQFQLADVAGKLPEEKTLNAIRKSWEKMTAAGREQALALPLDENLRALISKALA